MQSNALQSGPGSDSSDAPSMQSNPSRYPIRRNRAVRTAAPPHA